MKIREKITLSIILIFTIGVTSIGVIVGVFFYQNTLAQEKDKMFASSETRANLISTYLGDQKKYISTISLVSVFQDYLSSPENITYKNRALSMFTNFKKNNQDIIDLLLINKDGRVILSTNIVDQGVNKSTDEYFIEGTNSAHVKSIYLSPIINKYIYTLSAPIYNQKLLGVIVARMDAQKVASLTSDRTGLGKTGESFLINSDKYLITPSIYLPKENILNVKIDNSYIKNCFNLSIPTSTNISRHPDYRGIQVYSTFHYIPETNWCLITKADISEIINPFISVGIVGLIGDLIAIVVCIIVGNIISKKITNPIEKIIQATQNYSKGDFSAKIKSNLRDEIGTLSRTIDNMVDQIVESRKKLDIKIEEQTKEIKIKAENVDNQRKAILNILEDIDEEKQKVSIERDRMDIILHSIGDGVFVVDREQKITLINTTALVLNGSQDNNVIGENFNKIFKFSGNVINEEYESGKENKNKITLERKNGTKIGIANSSSPLRDNTGKIIGHVVIFRDVTHEQEVDRMKTEYISLVSHQLRTPLSAIKWFLEILLNGDAGKLSKDQSETIENINQSNNRMIALVNALLNISRIESGRIIIDPKPTSLENLVNQLMIELDNKIKMKHQSITLEIENNLPEINIDPQLITEVYKNLLTNAIKYTPEKGKITIRITQKDPDVISEIIDTGYGIPNKDINKVFTKFYRGDNIIKIESEGTGLGLYLVKSLIESSSGKIGFETKEGKGTKFWFSLPLSGSKPKTGEVTLNA